MAHFAEIDSNNKVHISEYDNTNWDSNGEIIQFNYGVYGIDPANTEHGN